MDQCAVMTWLAIAMAVLAFGVWLAELIIVIRLLRRSGRMSLSMLAGSMWMFRANSLGPAFEPERKRAVRLFLLFFLVIALAVPLSTGRMIAGCVAQGKTSIELPSL